jgi:putative ABC transport system permease protein
VTAGNVVRRSLAYFWRTNVAVVLGVGVAVAVLSGAMLVGESVRGSLRDLVVGRLGATDLAVSSPLFFRQALAADIAANPQFATSFRQAAPLIAVPGVVTAQESGRRAGRVLVYGVDDRFWLFHGIEPVRLGDREAAISPALASELEMAPGAAILVRVERPSDLPLESLYSRKETLGRTLRLTIASVTPVAQLGEFSLDAQQGAVRAVFVPLTRLSEELELKDRVNTVLVSKRAVDSEAIGPILEPLVRSAVTLADTGLRVTPSDDGTGLVVESDRGLLDSNAAGAVSLAANDLGAPARPVLTYLATRMTVGDRETPYSLVTAIDPLAPGFAAAAGASGPPPIVLNQWAADDLGARVGEALSLEYLVWEDPGQLTTRSTEFRVAGIVPLDAVSRDLAPDYPGISDSLSISDWDPPFPIDLRRVRRKDEDYWTQHRTTPKAFVPLAVGQRLWGSRYGNVTSMRVETPAGTSPAALSAALEERLRAHVDPFAQGMGVRDVRAEGVAASRGATDFGEYFIYFSFFIVFSALLLAGLFFALTVEQRARELGLLRAVGFTPRDVARLLLGEGLVVAVVGSVIGIAGAIGYASLIMYGLRTWWVGAVGTTALELHVDPLFLAAGAVGALAAAMLALFLSMRRLARRSARTLLTAGLSGLAADDGTAASTLGAAARNRGLAAGLTLAVAAGLIALAAAGVVNQVAAFFGAGGALLVAGCTALAWWLRRASPSSTRPRLIQFGAAYARWRPTRSVLSAALIAFACFVIVSVGAFRKDPAGASLARESGTGGFALIAESVAPLMFNPNTAAGRDELSLTGTEIERARVARFRLRPGDEASCLTLYQPRNPRLIAPEAAFIADPRFTFAQTIATTDAERANPWLLLNRRFDDGAIPAIADQTSLQYVFHLAVGDDFVFTPENSGPVRLRIVATLADSVLQSELIIGEDAFVLQFPHHEGYRVWMIEAPEADVPALTTMLEDRLSDFGVDVTDTRARLAAYHQVENTYLSTFQALGALGLLLGTLGLAAVLARNVLERRRELGLLGAVGFTPAHLRTLVTAESALVVGSGIAIGTVAALVAVAPALRQRATAVPFDSLAVLLIAVAATGLVASLLAVRLATSVRIVEAVKSE